MFDSTMARNTANRGATAAMFWPLDWLASRERCVLVFGVIFQLVVLLVMTATPLATLLTGETILLRTAPVDPRDLFRGDYVILTYDISRALQNDPAGRPGPDWDKYQDRWGKPVYVLLEPEADGKHWKSAGYQFDEPAEGKFIRGTLRQGNGIEFGIESYFVQEGEGRAYEDAIRDQKLAAEVVVDRHGKAYLKGLVIE